MQAPGQRPVAARYGDSSASPQRSGSAAGRMQRRHHLHAQQALGALEGVDFRPVPDDLGRHGELQQVAGLEVDEQQAGARVDARCCRAC